MPLAMDSSAAQRGLWPVVEARLSRPYRIRLTNVRRGWIEQWAARLRVLHCVLMGGHAPLLHVESNRLSLRCVGCGHQSPGWLIETPKRVRRSMASRVAKVF